MKNNEAVNSNETAPRPGTASSVGRKVDELFQVSYYLHMRFLLEASCEWYLQGTTCRCNVPTIRRHLVQMDV